MAQYTPRQGDLIAPTFDPQTEHEQRGRRPALVVSRDLFNKSTGLCIACPITNTRRVHPFRVELPVDEKVTGFVMVEQVKSIDYAARAAKLLGKAPPAVLQEVLSILDACIYEK
jgi:mRNA interferase MazF